eukprot:TRINITY_DN670_c0_g1_i2.p1 TRINITY_DN670_c0_g1~~TRINITY_DN670_c0_g1_i2.p1  ORF type:complete len:265 (+),score=38.80 TRINITY_DN670_c0_g1_i2:69-797(+)
MAEVHGRGPIRFNKSLSTGALRQKRTVMDRTVPYGAAGKVRDEDAWEHDLYDEVQEFDDPSDRSVFSRLGERVVSARGNVRGGIALSVSGLAYSVTEKDVKDLFSRVGSLVNARLIYDNKSGRPTGNAEVVFQNEADAETAIDQYNNITLDNRPMRVQLKGAAFFTEKGGQEDSAPSRRSSPMRARRAFPSRPTRGGRGAPRGGRGRPAGGRGGRGGRSSEKALPSLEQLDQDLDSYMQSSQ